MARLKGNLTADQHRRRANWIIASVQNWRLWDSLSAAEKKAVEDAIEYHRDMASRLDHEKGVYGDVRRIQTKVW